MKKLYLTLAFVISCVLSLNAQNWVFADQFASTGAVTTVDVKVDGNGDIYVVGNYINALTVSGLTALPYSDAGGKEDIFISKFDKNGNALWAKQIASASKDLVGGLAIDDSDNIYVVGGFQGDVLSFQGETADILNTQPGVGKYDAFVAKYDVSGNLLARDSAFWGDNVQRLLDITYDFTNDYLVIVGQFQGEVRYDSNGVKTQSAVSLKDHLLTRLDPADLSFVDKTVYNGSQKQSVFKNVNPCVIGGAVAGYFVSGDLKENLLDNTATVKLAAADASNMDIMVMRFGTDLSWVWGRKGGGSDFDHINSSGSDAFGNVYFTGKAQSASIVIDSTASLSSAARPSLGGQDFLVVSYNRDGNLRWFRRDGGPGTDNAYGMSVLGERILYTGQIDNGGNISSGFTVYDIEGNLIHTDSITGDGIETGLNVTFDLSGDSTIVIGSFDGDSLKAGDFKLDNTTFGTEDGFIVKYGFKFRIFLEEKTNVLCNGDNTGYIRVGTDFGTNPVTYAWTPDVSSTNEASGLTAGDYKIVATDDEGRKDSTTVTITEPSVLATSEVSVTSTSCNSLATSGNKTDGALDIDVSGGAGPYTYSWSPGLQTTQDLTGVGAGDHIVTVTDDNGCVEVDTFTVTEPSKVGHGGSTVVPITTAGNDGEVQLNTYGGTGTYAQYSWSWTGPAGSGFTSAEDSIKDLAFTGSYDLTVTDLNSCTFDTSFIVSDSNTVIAYILSQDVTSVTCKGDANGALKVSHDGGVAPYTYAWRTTLGDPVGGNTQTIGGLPAGTYFVRVTDSKGVWGEASETISEPSLAISAWEDSIKTPTCYEYTDGAAYISVTGGWGKYTYLWVPSGKTTQDLTGVGAGSYSVTITDSLGCVYSHPTPFVVPEASELKDSISISTAISCYEGSDGALTSNPSGGTEPYTYLWDDPGAQTTKTATNLDAKDFYKVIVTDAHGCLVSTKKALTDPPVVELVSVAMEEPCFGDSNGTIVIAASGGVGGYQYGLSGGVMSSDSNISNLKAGTYTVAVEDANGCPSGGGIDSTVTLPQPDAALAIGSIVTDSTTTGTTNDGSITINDVTGGTPYPGDDKYLYRLDNGNDTISNVFADLDSGTYMVYVTDANNCVVSQEAVVGDKAVGVNDIIGFRAVLIYPNPSNGQFTIELDNPDQENLMLEIMNITGQLVYKTLHMYNGNPRFRETIDLGEQARGTYFMRVNGLPVRAKLMIE